MGRGPCVALNFGICQACQVQFRSDAAADVTGRGSSLKQRELMGPAFISADLPSLSRWRASLLSCPLFRKIAGAFKIFGLPR